MKFIQLSIIGLSSLLLGGCISTEYKTIEVPKYIERPMPELKVYEVNSSYTFTRLKKENGYIKVPIKQFKEYVGIKMDLEASLEKANNQVRIYNKKRTKK